MRRLDRIAAGVDGGVLKPVVGAVVPFARAIDAYEQVMTGHTRGKIRAGYGGPRLMERRGREHSVNLAASAP
jgi:hypothetical protein